MNVHVYFQAHSGIIGNYAPSTTAEILCLETMAMHKIVSLKFKDYGRS
jgi:hypothetical protein